MDVEKSKARVIIAASVGQKRLAFQIGRRGTNLLISNCLGVWSLRHRRYVKKTRFYILKTRVGLVAKKYASLRKLGMLSWPEYGEQRVALSWGRLADAYWGAAPAWYRERAAAYLRAARRDERRQHLVFWLCVAMQTALCLFVAKVAWSGVLPARTMFLHIFSGFFMLYKPIGNTWHETFRGPDVIVRMLEVV